ncbi:MAG: 50S ribosomal protein L22 [Holosporales bacterium]|jgi:large subunit ribosomal protein L22|nr:50S ribosomal protein L22 [Holosporales bacterium]
MMMIDMEYNNTARAILRKIRVSPEKLNIVAAMIRGMRTDRAIGALTHCKRRIAVEVRKTLQSAIANAENNHGLDIDNLYVKEAYVGHSLTLKRFHPRGRGRGGRVRKPFSHLSIIVEQRG